MDTMAVSPTPSDQIQLEDIQNYEQWAQEQPASAMQVDPTEHEEKSSPYSSAQSDSPSGSTEVSDLSGRITTDDDHTCDAQTFFHKFGPPLPYEKSDRSAPKRTKVEALTQPLDIFATPGVVQYPPKVIPSARKFLRKISNMPKRQRAEDLPAKYIKEHADKYCVDKRPVVTAEDPPALISKLGVPTEGSDDEEGIHVPLHIRALTGCDLSPEHTTSTGLSSKVGPAADRTILVHGEGLGKGVTLREAACTLAGQFLFKEEHNHPLGHLVDKIKKGARKESERDSGLREVLLLEAVSPTAAQAILQNPYDFGVPTTHIWLPSKNQTEESNRTGVVVIDYKQVLFTSHRSSLVEAIAAHIQKLTASTNKLESLKDIFCLHVGTGQWAPSTWGDPATLIQWKRTGNRTINHYCVLTQPARTAGKADSGAIPPEVTKTLSDLAQQLKLFNDELPSGIQKLRELQLTEDSKTADRHRELLILLGSVVTTQKESSEAAIL
ncbi:hypothetical protein CYMTET_40479 [Cymbomonas tetramitiformis]|uniref:Uncharacterized protein n=1 Tax=Cymbomonas tetramitiformis TaxID=36881 RepID=A0AAE0C9D4_9CHLO|nr:hypothetical protein CYMTET_40479 [Cymbomonas tetramitiformis]